MNPLVHPSSSSTSSSSSSSSSLPSRRNDGEVAEGGISDGAALRPSGDGLTVFFFLVVHLELDGVGTSSEPLQVQTFQRRGERRVQI